MLTKIPFSPPKLTGDWEKDGPAVLQAMTDFVTRLNDAGAVEITEAGKLDTSGDLVVDGNATLGNAAGDSVTVNGATFDYAAVSARIKGDFSNSTFGSRTAFQDRATNNGTSVGVLPNGTSNNSNFTAYSSSSPDNSHYLSFRVGATSAQVDSGKLGSGTQRALELAINGTTLAKLETDGKWIVRDSGGTKTITSDSSVPALSAQDSGGSDGTLMRPQYVEAGHVINGTARLYPGYLALTDGVSAPSPPAGFAGIYVDTSDGDLKVKFADGTVKTIVTDT